MIVITAILIAAACGLNIANVFLQQRTLRHHYETRRYFLMLIAQLSNELEKYGHTYPNREGLSMRQWALRHQGETERKLAHKLVF